MTKTGCLIRERERPDMKEKDIISPTPPSPKLLENTERKRPGSAHREGDESREGFGMEDVPRGFAWGSGIE